jgi:hypothetical protein
MSRTRAAIALALAVAPPSLAACGDQGPSKQDFLAKADPVCRQRNELAEILTTPSDVPGIKEFATKLADITTTTTARLRALKYPKGKDGAAAKAFVRSMNTAAASARAVAAPVDQGDYGAIDTAAAKLVEAYKAADGQARTYGSTECGRGEADAAGKLGQTVGATTKAAYIAKVDALCAAATKEVDKLNEPKTFAEAKTYLDQTAALAEKLASDMKAVPQPTTDRDKLAAALSSVDALVAKVKEAQAAAAAGDEHKTLSLLDEVGEAGATSDAKADAYGFKDCGSQGS